MLVCKIEIAILGLIMRINEIILQVSSPFLSFKHAHCRYLLSSAAVSFTKHPHVSGKKTAQRGECAQDGTAGNHQIQILVLSDGDMEGDPGILR